MRAFVLARSGIVLENRSCNIAITIISSAAAIKIEKVSDAVGTCAATAKARIAPAQLALTAEREVSAAAMETISARINAAIPLWGIAPMANGAGTTNFCMPQFEMSVRPDAMTQTVRAISAASRAGATHREVERSALRQ